MKNELLYNKTINILKEAYFNNTLQHNNCYACAVGNIIAGNMGLKFYMGDRGTLIWEDHRSDYSENIKTITSAIIPFTIHHNNLNKFHKEQLESSGYSE